MPLLSEDGDRGVWSTVDSDIIVMETGAGLARAVKPGRAVVKYSLGNYVTTATSLDVHPLQYVSTISFSSLKIASEDDVKNSQLSCTSVFTVEPRLTRD